jgi:thiol-disulfide isomerase/thioredoxin
LLFQLTISQVNNDGKKIEAATITRTEELPQVNFKAPSFNLSGIDGKNYSPSFVKDTPLVINFWASWCGPCRMEAPELVKLHKQYEDKVKIYAVNMTGSDSLKGANQFAKEYSFEFPVLLDSNDQVSTKYRVLAIPTTFFVDKNGKIIDIITGYGGKEILAEKFELLSTKGN